MRARATLFATIAIVSVAGCKDSGLPDRNLPFDEAAHRAPDSLVMAVYPELRPGGASGMPMDANHAGMGEMPMDSTHAGMTGMMADTTAMPMDAAHGMPGAAASMSARPVQIGEQTFVAAGTPTHMDAATLRQVGAMGGMSFFAARGDDAPYGRLWMTHPGGEYVMYMPVHDSGDPEARAAAMQHGLESGAPAAH